MLEAPGAGRRRPAPAFSLCPAADARPDLVLPVTRVVDPRPPAPQLVDPRGLGLAHRHAVLVTVDTHGEADVAGGVAADEHVPHRLLLGR